MTPDEMRHKLSLLRNSFTILIAAQLQNISEEKQASINAACVDGTLELFGEMLVDVKRIADALSVKRGSNHAG